MKRCSRLAVVVAAIVLLCALHVDRTRGQDTASPSWSPLAAAAYLDGRAKWWLGWSGAARGRGTACLSCHTSVPFALARPALARQLGETTVGAAEQQVIDQVKKRVANWAKIVADPAAGEDPFVAFYGKSRKPSALGTEAVLNALALVNQDAQRAGGVLSATTRQALDYLWEQQQESGAWLWLDFGLNPWENDGAYYGAALAALAVGTAGKDYYQRPEIQVKVAALKRYLRTQGRNQPVHHRTVALWASSRLPGILTDQDRKELMEELLAAQEADGGWSLPKLGKTASGPRQWQSHGVYPNGASSDGYATGLVVLALKSADVAADHPGLRKGLGWLAGQQREGTWPIRYPNRARDPHSDVGKFLRDAATAFAILALTEPAQRPGP